MRGTAKAGEDREDNEGRYTIAAALAVSPASENGRDAYFQSAPRTMRKSSSNR